MKYFMKTTQQTTTTQQQQQKHFHIFVLFSCRPTHQCIIPYSAAKSVNAKLSK